MRENENVTLGCDATGYPKPHIVWRREDGEDIVIGGKKVNMFWGKISTTTFGLECEDWEGIVIGGQKKCQNPCFSIENILGATYSNFWLGISDLRGDLFEHCHWGQKILKLLSWNMNLKG